MKFIKKYFSMYTNLPKEIYVLAFGRIMTSMGCFNMANVYFDYE